MTPAQAALNGSVVSANSTLAQYFRSGGLPLGLNTIVTWGQRKRPSACHLTECMRNYPQLTLFVYVDPWITPCLVRPSI